MTEPLLQAINLPETAAGADVCAFLCQQNMLEQPVGMLSVACTRRGSLVRAEKRAQQAATVDIRKQYSGNPGKHDEVMSLLKERKLNRFVQLRVRCSSTHSHRALITWQVELPRTKAARVKVDNDTVTIVIDGDNFAALFGTRASSPAAQTLISWARAEEAAATRTAPAATAADPALATKVQRVLMDAARSPASKPTSRRERQPNRKCKLLLSLQPDQPAP